MTTVHDLVGVANQSRRRPRWRRLGIAAATIAIATVAVDGPAPVSAAAPQRPIGVGAIITGSTSARRVTVDFQPDRDGDQAAAFSVTCVSSTGGDNASTTVAESPAVLPVTHGALYNCWVRAVNGDGISAPTYSGLPDELRPTDVHFCRTGELDVVWSEPTRDFCATGSYTVPDAPDVFELTRIGRFARIGASLPGNTGGPGLRMFGECRSSNGGAYRSSFLPTDGPYTIGGLTPGKTYQCALSAANVVGWSEPGVASSTIRIPLAPGTPRSIGVTRDGLSARVAFTSPLTNGGSPITRYVASCYALRIGHIVRVSGTGSPIVVDGLAPGENHQCSIYAVNEIGRGGAIATASFRVPAPPTRPALRGLTTSGDDAVVAFASPTSNGGSPITGFEASCGASPWIAGSSTPITVPDVVPAGGGNLTCSVRAINEIGPGPAETGTFTIPPPSPALSPASTTVVEDTVASTVETTEAPVESAPPSTDEIVDTTTTEPVATTEPVPTTEAVPTTAETAPATTAPAPETSVAEPVAETTTAVTEAPTG